MHRCLLGQRNQQVATDEEGYNACSHVHDLVGPDNFMKAGRVGSYNMPDFSPFLLGEGGGASPKLNPSLDEIRSITGWQRWLSPHLIYQQQLLAGVHLELAT